MRPVRIDRSSQHVQPDPRLEQAARLLVAIGVVAVLALPAARGHSAWLGSLPMWLLGMPLASWWALHRFALPHWPRPARTPRRRRGGLVQARRRGAVRRDAGQLRAA